MRVQPDRRSKIETVEERFEKMHRRCSNDSDYCMKKNKDPIRPPDRMDDIMEVSTSPTASRDIGYDVSGGRLGRWTRISSSEQEATNDRTSLQQDEGSRPGDVNHSLLDSPMIYLTAPNECQGTMVSTVPGRVAEEQLAGDAMPSDAIVPSARYLYDVVGLPDLTQQAHINGDNDVDARDLENGSRFADQLSNGSSPPITAKPCKRQRFKQWVSKVLECCLPEHDSNISEQPRSQRLSRFLA